MDSSALSESCIIETLASSFGVLFKGRNFARLLAGLGTTVWISAVSVLISLVAGILLGIVMSGRNKAVKTVCKIYLEFMRIMPQLALLFIAYYGLTRAFGISLSGEAASILVFSLWGTAEMGDLVRGALESIPQSQYDSARALALTERQIFFYIILPQTLRRLIPLAMNLITRMIKTTSLVVFVGVIEVVKIGQQIIEANRIKVPSSAVAVYTVIFFMYFIVCGLFSCAARIIEQKQRNE